MKINKNQEKRSLNLHHVKIHEPMRFEMINKTFDHNITIFEFSTWVCFGFKCFKLTTLSDQSFVLSLAVCVDQLLHP